MAHSVIFVYGDSDEEDMLQEAIIDTLNANAFDSKEFAVRSGIKNPTEYKIEVKINEQSGR